MNTELRGNNTPTPASNPRLFNSPQYSLSGALQGCLGSLDGPCIEKLLLHCASALENNDVTSAQQVMWVLNNVASSNGDPNQRLTSWFLKALVSRASRVWPAPINLTGSSNTPRRLLSATELAGYVDLLPWHRFGFCASNGEIFKAIQCFPKVHILDFSISHCMQWPTFIDALAKRPEGPPLVRITVPFLRPHVPPLLDVSIEIVGNHLANFAKGRDVPFEFNVIQASDSSIAEGGNGHISMSRSHGIKNLKDSSTSFHHDVLLSQLNPSTLNLRDDEILVVNCQNWLRYLPIEGNGITPERSSRDAFLEIIKGLNPRIIIIVDEDCDLSGSSLQSRITACLNYLWIPFDALETFLPKDSHQRIEYEADIGNKIENVIGFEGVHQMERLESGKTVADRMRKTGYLSVPFCDETIKEVKFLLDEHASGWGMKKEDDMLVLTWKGHSSVYATVWVPCGYGD